jgi:hypothetical protein
LLNQHFLLTVGDGADDADDDGDRTELAEAFAPAAGVRQAGRFLLRCYREPQLEGQRP